MTMDFLMATSALLAVIVLAAAALHGWNGWLALKRHELDHSSLRRREPEAGVSREVAARIELADLRERVRKLEAIASGVDL